MNLNLLLLQITPLIPKDTLTQNLIKEKLEKLDEAQRSEFALNLNLLKLKSPKLVFWLGSVLLGNFGVGRFMIGDIFLGLLRLFCLCLSLSFIFYALSEFLAFLLSENEEHLSQMLGSFVLGFIFVVVLNLWWLIDMFLVDKKLRKQNLEKISALLA